MDKTYASAAEAVADIPAGASLAVGGFGLSGVPIVLIRALLARGVDGLEVVSNNCGVDGWGLGELLAAGRIRRVIASYIGENKEFARQYLARRGGGRADAAGDARGASARRRCRHPRVLHGDRCRHGGLRRRDAHPLRPRRHGRRAERAEGAAAVRRVRAHQGVRAGDRRSAPTSGWYAPPSATGTGICGSSSRHATSTRWPEWPGASRSRRWTSSSSPACSGRTTSICPGSTSTGWCS